MNTYVQRRTVNFKEGIDVPRIFVQGKYRKPIENNGTYMNNCKFYFGPSFQLFVDSNNLTNLVKYSLLTFFILT